MRSPSGVRLLCMATGCLLTLCLSPGNGSARTRHGVHAAPVSTAAPAPVLANASTAPLTSGDTLREEPLPPPLSPPQASPTAAFAGFLVLLGGLALYLLPVLIALGRRHHQRVAIGVLNLLLGWTVLGWILTLVWACTAINPALQAPGTPHRLGYVTPEDEAARRVHA